MDNFTTKSTIFAISLLGIDSQYSYNKGSSLFSNVSKYQLKRFLDENWDENEKLQKLVLSQNIDWSKGWLSIDDTLLEKPHSKEIEGVYWQYSSKINDFEKGINVTFLTWSNGKKIVPICFMVYEKDENNKAKMSKNEFAVKAVEYAKSIGIEPMYVNFDSKYSSSDLLNVINDLNWIYYTQLPQNRVFNTEQLKKQEFHLEVKAGKLKKVGHMVSVIKHCRRYYATNAGKNVSRQQILRSYKTRWGIEDFFRSLKQLCHIKECKSRTIKQQRRYILMSIQAFMVLQAQNRNTIYEAKVYFQQKFMGKRINGNKALRYLAA